MPKDQGDEQQPYKKFIHSGERRQLDKSDKKSFIPSRYNPLEEVANINKLDKL